MAGFAGFPPKASPGSGIRLCECASKGPALRTAGVFERTFAQIRRDTERALAPLDAVEIRCSPHGRVRSATVMMLHVGGNPRSRLTDFLASGGERPWRHREGEFVDGLPPGEAGRDAAWRSLQAAIRSNLRVKRPAG